MQARDKAERQPRWREVARLVEQADDVADALEESAFLIYLVADEHLDGWNGKVRKAIAALAATVLDATRITPRHWRLRAASVRTATPSTTMPSSPRPGGWCRRSGAATGSCATHVE